MTGEKAKSTIFGDFCHHLLIVSKEDFVTFEMALSSARSKLIGVIGDEDTCTGFLLGGIGERNMKREGNFFIVDKDTSLSDIENTVKLFIKRPDIDIILITQSVAEQDSILRRAKGLFNPEDLR